MSKPTTNMNVGDWSETYAFFRMLGEHEIHSCDEYLNKTGESYPVLRVIRAKNKKDTIVCRYNGILETWEIFEGESEVGQIEAAESMEEADDLLLRIQDKTKSADKYKKAIKFLERLHIESIKSDSTHKQDISLQIADVRAGTDPTCGFSIKSYLGQPPTLLNSSKDCTNFLYEVEGITPSDIKSLNEANGPVSLMQALKARGVKLHFIRCCSDVFAGNLEAVDSNAEQIVGELLSLHYLHNIKNIKDVTEELMRINPLRFRKTDTYNIVVKRLLEIVALGMTPGTEWNGETDNTSGIIIVKPDGDVVTYHVYNRDAFKQYLYLSTFFDNPSSSRHQYAELFEENGKIYIKLALQVRFRKSMQ